MRILDQGNHDPEQDRGKSDQQPLATVIEQKDFFSHNSETHRMRFGGLLAHLSRRVGYFRSEFSNDPELWLINVFVYLEKSMSSDDISYWRPASCKRSRKYCLI